MTDKCTLATRADQAVDDRAVHEANRSMPGNRKALPVGALQRTAADPQGDENRTPAEGQHKPIGPKDSGPM